MKDRELTDTIEGMTSTDYKERFKSEYYQVKIRVKKLREFIYKLNNNQLDFIPKCDVSLLQLQLFYMQGYELVLRERAMKEGIELEVKGENNEK